MTSVEDLNGKEGKSSFKDVLMFVILFAIRVFSAYHNVIPDADDTFNFWEPTHYLAFNFGLQTWEYSAEYGLRSYTILIPFAIFARAMNWLFDGNKAMVFYAIRILLAFLCSLSETLFVAGVRRIFGKTTSWVLFLLLAFSSGMYTASTSFVNASLAMISIFFSYGVWMMYDNHFLGLLIGAAAVVYDWPFVGVVFIPMGLDCLYRRGLKKTILYGIVIVTLVLGLDLATNYHFTHKLTIPAINIVLYNVLGIGGGPELYGVEPWHFYFVNGLLNNNLVFFCALLLPLALLLPSQLKATKLQTLLVTHSGFVLLLIFCSQAHKEERFLYITYPLLYLSAAITISIILLLLQNKMNPESNGLVITFVILMIIPYALLCSARVASSIHNYSAPLDLYNHLYRNELGRKSQREVNVCLGKEWYRFGSSFFIPSNKQHVQFIKSGFDGLLPQPFKENTGTWEIPEHMNTHNEEDFTRYIPESECDYIVEQKLPVQVERDYLEDKDFRVVKMGEYLDATNTPFPYRSFYIPMKEYVKKMRYNPYYILKRVSRNEEVPVEVCVEEDKCVLQSSDEYVDEEVDL